MKIGEAPMIATSARRKIISLVVLLLAGPAWLCAEPAPETKKAAGGIRTDFGNVTVENIGIGKTYNLRDLAGIPFKVTNTGASTVDLLISPEIPTMDQIRENAKGAGFLPIPSKDWINPIQRNFLVPSGESAYTDLIITIPNDPSLYGKKFQGSIFSRTNTPGILNVGIWSHLFFIFVPNPEEQAKIEKSRQKGIVEGLEYTLLPDKIFLESCPIGKTVDVRKTVKRTIMIANSGTVTAKLKSAVVALKDTPLSVQTGYEPGNPAWLKIREPNFEIEPSDFHDPGLSVVLPNDPTLRGKKLMFVFKIDPAEKNVTGVTFYGKVYVEVEK
jgi:hypothetical protein